MRDGDRNVGFVKLVQVQMMSSSSFGTSKEPLGVFSSQKQGLASKAPQKQLIAALAFRLLNVFTLRYLLLL